MTSAVTIVKSTGTATDDVSKSGDTNSSHYKSIGRKSTMLINTKEVAKGLQAVKQTGQKGVVLSVHKGCLLLRGGSADPTFSLTWQQPKVADAADVDELLLEHKVLAGIVRAAPEQVSVDLSDQGIHLRTDNAYWKVSALEKTDGRGKKILPEPIPVGGRIKLGFEMPINQFREIVRLLALSAASTGTHRPVLQTVLIAYDEQTPIACTTDTYRLRIMPLTQYYTKGKLPAPQKRNWTQMGTLPVIPLKAVAKALSKLPKKYSKPVCLQLRSKVWTVSCGSVQLIAGYGSDMFPDARKVISSHDDTVWALTLDADELWQALLSLDPIAASDSNRVTLDWQGGQEITLKVEDREVTDASEAEVRLPCKVKCKKKKWRVAFNCRYLLDGIEGREGEVTIEQGGYEAKWGNTSPALLDFGEEGLYLLMPMMIL